MTDSRMNFHEKAPKIPPRILHRHAGRDLTFRVPGVPGRGSKENATHFEEICGGNALNAAIGIVRLGGRASVCGPMGDVRETSSRYIFDKLAHEGIETNHIVHMPGLVTPISAIMIDPSGERTIVTFRDPELWKVSLPPTETLLEDCAAIFHREPRRAILYRSLRRGAQTRHSRHRRRRSRDVASRGIAQRILASGVLQRAAAGDGRYRRRRKGAAQDRHADPPRFWRDKGPKGTIWLDENGAIQETPAFPVHTVDTLGAGDVFHGAFALAITEKQELRQALRFASAAAALKCTRFGGAFAAPQRIEVEELLNQGHSANSACTGQ